MRISDWSSDVCSSDLPAQPYAATGRRRQPAYVRSRPRSAATTMTTFARSTVPSTMPGKSGSKLKRRLPHCAPHFPPDRKRVVQGKSVSVRVDLGGRRILKKKQQQNNTKQQSNKQ